MLSVTFQCAESQTRNHINIFDSTIFNLIKIGGKVTFLLEEITIPLLLLDSRASTSSRAPPRPQNPQKPVTNPHFTVSGPGWCLEQVQVTTGAAFLPRRAPPHCTTAHNAHVHVPGWLTPQIFTPYFATKNIYTVFCNKSFIFFNLKLLTAPCSADTPSIYTIICNQLLNWSFYRTRVRSLAMLVSNSVNAV